MAMFTDEELATMSESEREFAKTIEADDPDLTGHDANASQDGGGAGSDEARPAADGKPAAQPNGEPSAAEDGAANPEAPEAGAEVAPPSGEAPTPPDQQRAPESAEPQPEPEPLRRTAPSDAGDQRATLRTERSEALAKLLDGEMTQKEFAEIEARVDDKLNELIRAEAADQARQQFAHDTMVSEYRGLLSEAHKAGKALGLDGISDKESEIGKEFDRAVRMFAMEAGEKGMADRPGALSASKQALDEALALVARRHGKNETPKAEKTDAEQAQQAVPPKAPVRQVKPVDRSTIPPTLAQVPTAADATVASEFAYLDNLDGIALEKAVAKLSPEAMDRYLAA